MTANSRDRQQDFCRIRFDLLYFSIIFSWLESQKSHGTIFGEKENRCICVIQYLVESSWMRQNECAGACAWIFRSRARASYTWPLASYPFSRIPITSAKMDSVGPKGMSGSLCISRTVSSLLTIAERRPFPLNFYIPALSKHESANDLKYEPCTHAVPSQDV